MKQIELSGIRAFQIVDAPAPEPGPGEVLVKMGRVGICGSDMHLYRTGEVGGLRCTFPHVVGHECMGVIAGVGDGVSPARIGERVAIEPHRHCGTCPECLRGVPNVCLNDRFLGTPPEPGALKEYLATRADLAVAIPDRVSDNEAVMFEPMAIALHAVSLLKPKPGQDAVILGTGVIGSCVLLALSMYRGLKVFCVDLLADRLARAATLGADHTLLAREGEPADVAAEVMERTGGRGADLVFECAGVKDTFINSVDCCGPCGHVALIGIPDEDVMPLPASHARRRGITLRPIRRSLHTLEPCIDLASRGVLKAEQLVTHTFPASETAEAFALVERYGDGVLKAMVDLTAWG